LIRHIRLSELRRDIANEYIGNYHYQICIAHKLISKS
jgi:hypothetical protein